MNRRNILQLLGGLSIVVTPKVVKGTIISRPIETADLVQPGEYTIKLKDPEGNSMQLNCNHHKGSLMIQIIEGSGKVHTPRTLMPEDILIITTGK